MTLGLSDRGFFRLTPRQLDILLDRHAEQRNHQEFLTGILASTIANFGPHPPKEPFKPKDFMPTPKKRERSPSKAHQIAQMRAFLMSRVTHTEQVNV